MTVEKGYNTPLSICNEPSIINRVEKRAWGLVYKLNLVFSSTTPLRNNNHLWYHAPAGLKKPAVAAPGGQMVTGFPF